MARAPEGDAAQVADRVDGDLRVIGAGLDAEVAVAPCGLERRRPRTAGAARASAAGGDASPNRSAPSLLEQRRPEPDRDRQAAGRQVPGLAGVVRRRLRVDRRRPRWRSRRGPGSSARRRTTIPAAAPTRSSRVARADHVERREVKVILDRRRDAGLVRTEERVDRRRADDPLATAASAAGRRRRRRCPPTARPAAPADAMPSSWRRVSPRGAGASAGVRLTSGRCSSAARAARRAR